LCAADEARDNFASTVSRVAAGEERVIVSQDGKEVAAIISTDEFCFLERVIEKLEDEMDVEEAKKILAETNPEDYIPYERIKN
jgi:prevent-host-death family protein